MACLNEKEFKYLLKDCDGFAIILNAGMNKCLEKEIELNIDLDQDYLLLLMNFLSEYIDEMESKAVEQLLF